MSSSSVQTDPIQELFTKELLTKTKSGQILDYLETIKANYEKMKSDNKSLSQQVLNSMQ